jgi:hypothetical protein
MVINFRAHEISQDTRKLTRTPMSNLKKKEVYLIAQSTIQ